MKANIVDESKCETVLLMESNFFILRPPMGWNNKKDWKNKDASKRKGRDEDRNTESNVYMYYKLFVTWNAYLLVITGSRSLQVANYRLNLRMCRDFPFILACSG